MNIMLKHKNQFQIFAYFFIIIFLLECSNQDPDRKILLKSVVKVDPEEENAKIEEMMKIQEEFSVKDKVSILVLPFTSNFNNVETLILTSSTDFTATIFNDNQNIIVYPISIFRKRNHFKDLDLNESLGRIIEYELIDYYLETDISNENNRMSIEYSLIDVKTKSAVNFQTLNKSNIAELVDGLNEMGRDIYLKLFTSTDYDFIEAKTNLPGMIQYVDGILAEEENNVDLALTKYLESINQEPGFGKNYLKIISLYFHDEEKFQNLDIKFYVETAEEYVNQFSEKDNLTLSAYRHYYFNKPDVAVTYFNDLKEKYPDDPEAYIGLGKIYLLKNQPEEVLKNTSLNLKLFKSNRTLQILQSAAYAGIGNFSDALEILIQNNTGDSTNVDIDFEMAKIYYEMGRYEEALRISRNILAKRDDFNTAKLLIGLIYFNQMNFQKSIDILTSINFTDSNLNFNYLVEYNYNLFLSYIYLGQYTNAVTVGKNLLKLYENNNYIEEYIYTSVYTSYLLSEIKNLDDMFGVLIPNFDDSIRQYDLFLLIYIINNEVDHIELKQSISSMFSQTNNDRINDDKEISDLKDGLDNWYAGDHKGAINKFLELYKIEANPILTYYITKSYLELNDLNNADKFINSFYSNLNVNSFSTGIILPKIFLLQAEILEKSNRNLEAKQIYSNLNNMWLFSDEILTLKQELETKEKN